VLALVSVVRLYTSGSYYPIALEHLIQMSTDTSYAEGDRDRDKGGDSDRSDKAEKGLKQKSSGAKGAISRLFFYQRFMLKLLSVSEGSIARTMQVLQSRRVYCRSILSFLAYSPRTRAEGSLHMVC